MNIVFDYQIFSYQNYGGISRYITELAEQCDKIEDMNVTALALMHKNRYLLENQLNCCKGFYVPHFSKTTRARLFLNDRLTRLSLKVYRPDIVHHSYYDIPAGNPGYKTVVTVHDMIHEKFPTSFNSSDKTPILKKRAVQRADHIICVSNTTRNDLLYYYDLEPERISVVYLGHGLKDNADSKDKPVFKSPYILYVGERGIYKNFKTLVTAYGTHRSLHKDYKLICFGGGSFNKSEKALFRKYNVADYVEHKTGSDGLLKNLYTHASIFVFPSLCEGFGIPILEAMSCGCPVACSKKGSLPEIASNAAVYFDPKDKDSMANTLEEVLFSDDRSTKLRNAGLQRSKLFSWEQCAEETAKIYRDLVNCTSFAN